MSDTRISDLQIAEGYCRERLAATRAALAAAQSRAAGYALLVKELTGHLVVVRDMGSAGGGWADWECLCCHATRFGALDVPPQIVHESDCILAADPEARAMDLGKAAMEEQI